MMGTGARRRAHPGVGCNAWNMPRPWPSCHRPCARQLLRIAHPTGHRARRRQHPHQPSLRIRPREPPRELR
ncbi:hypothetical protein RZS08_50775, partial [Arthrospira platensis SPKY1]|nr:hypothetical protein [Arthrospira platensis SPKY1]